MDIKWYIENEKGERLTFTTNIDGEGIDFDFFTCDNQSFAFLEEDIRACVDDDFQDIEPKIDPSEIERFKTIYKDRLREKINILQKKIDEE